MQSLKSDKVLALRSIAPINGISRQKDKEVCCLVRMSCRSTFPWNMVLTKTIKHQYKQSPS
jgi:hypothetical protein